MRSSRDRHDSGRKRGLFLLLRILATLIILLVIFLRVDLRGMGSAFLSMDVRIFLLAVALLPLNLLLQIYRWYFILNTAGIVSSPRETAASLLVGLTFGLVTPGRIGEVGRALHIRSAGTVHLAGLIILEKVFSLFTVLLTSAVSLILWGHEIIGCAIIAGTLFAAFHLDLIRSLLSRLSFMLPRGEAVAELWTGWRTFDRRRIASLLAISICFFSIVFLQFYILVSAFQRTGILSALIAIPLTIAVNSIPITVAGLGLREGAAVFFFSRFGVGQAGALNGALLLFGVDLLIPGLIGLLLIPRKMKRPTQEINDS